MVATCVYKNGELQDTQCVVDIEDRALSYGDGLFETCRVQQGAVQYWEEHWQRLYRGAKVLSLALPEPTSFYAQYIEPALAHCGEQAVLKIILSRGSSGRGYRYNALSAAQQSDALVIFAIVYPPTSYPQHYVSEGIQLTLCDTPVSVNPLLAGLKHLNRLENVLARNEWQDEYQEGIMLDANGHVIEGTMSNVFLFDGARWLTPIIDVAGVEGVIRHHVLTFFAEQNIVCEECKIDESQLVSAKHIFVCNSLIGVWEVAGYKQEPKSLSSIVTDLRKYLVFE